MAASPQVWRGIQQQIRRQEPAPTFSIASIRRFLLFGVPAAAAVLLIVFFVSRPASDPGPNPVPTQTALVGPAEVTSPVPEVSNSVEPEKVNATSALRKQTSRRTKTVKNLRGSARPQNAAPSDPAEAVIKTEFIALSYARDPESGQIVRVKVPRSMMVTVGLVASVEKPMSLVDAEVLIGDDGLTRAIRFIR